jgi:tetratricopeptide (TPR) repeat protein
MLVGLGQVCLCPSSRVGVAFVVGVALLSPRAAGLALLGALAATAWAFWRQQDARLLASGWYGANGALWGLWSSWFVADPLGAALLTALGATLAAWMLDAITFPLGDAPVCLPPLSAPFVVLALFGAVALSAVHGAVETIDDLRRGRDRPIPSTPWTGPRLAPWHAERVAAAWRAYERGEHDRAQELFGRVAREAPEVAEAHNGFGWAAFRRDFLGDAEGAFRRALELDARHPYALDGLGWLAFRSGRLNEAASRFAAARGGAPAWADPHDGLGWVAYKRGRYREARAHFRGALERDPAYADAMAGSGWIAITERRPEEARAWFESAAATDPRSVVARTGLGWALTLSGRAKDGERVLLDVLRQSPAHEDALAGLAHARRQLVLRGHRNAGELAEGRALGRVFGVRALILAGVALAVVLWAPWAGLLGVGFAALGAVAGAAVGGSVAFLWSDLYLQTLAVLGVLVGRSEPFGLHGLGIAVLVGMAGVAAWGIMHVAGITVPLLAFNGVGFIYLFVRRRLTGRAWRPAVAAG